jgi:hypothetical protein
MIIVGEKKVRLLNPTQIVHLELTKGKVTAFVKGDNDGDIITVDSITVREPWTVVIRTPIETHYINCKDFDSAFEHLLGLCREIDPKMNYAYKTDLERKLRKVYGQEKAKEQK